MAKLKIQFSWQDELVVEDTDPDAWPMIRGYLRGICSNPEARNNNPSIRIEPYVQPVTEDDDD